VPAHAIFGRHSKIKRNNLSKPSLKHFLHLPTKPQNKNILSPVGFHVH
jgi:hypothetical protein